MTDPTMAAALAAVFAFFLLMASHWATGKLLGRDLDRRACYVAGCALIALAFGVWCWLVGDWPALIALVLILIGAGLGTLFAYRLDHVDGLRTENAILHGQQRAKTDRGS